MRLIPIKHCKCHDVPMSHGHCVIKKRARDRAIQERRIQIMAGGVRMSYVLPSSEEAEQVRSRMLNFRSKQQTDYKEMAENGWID